MPVIVDCYNVLHATMPPSLAGLDEAGLCRALARRFAGERVVVVCDGAVKPGTPAVSPVDGVELVYAGRGKSADDLIERLIADDSAPRRLVVVSSDRQIQKAANRRGCKALGSDELVHLLARAAPGAPAESDRDAKLTPEQVDDWIKRFGF